MPWWMKIAAKIVLSNMPISYGSWSKLGLFKHGNMSEISYAKKIFLLHFFNAYDSFASAKDKVVLELGPGDSVMSALIAASCGARKVYLVDVGDFAIKNVEFYVSMAKELRRDERFSSVPVLTKDMTFAEMLSLLNAEYLTDGVNSLRSIDSASIDFVWSHSVLEHIRKHLFQECMLELYRITKVGAIISHNVDLMDHLGGKLNNLRFSDKVWESELMANAGFYTNRLRAPDYKQCFLSLGYKIIKYETGKWPELPTSRKVMRKEYSCLHDEELLVRTLSVVMMKLKEL